MPTLEPIIAASPWALAILALAYAVPRLLVAFLAVRKVPADKLAEVLRALAELFRAGR